METLVGSVERITFYNQDNGYCVLRLRPNRKGTPGLNREGLVTVTGNMPELAVGEFLSLQGKWITHPKHGLQFQADICEQTLPATTAGIQRYLGSGLIKGIGPRLAERIVNHFGEQTLEVIEEQPTKLREVPDIGPKRARMIASAWDEQKQVKEIMIFLHSYGVSTNLAIKIYKQYGDDALQVVQSDPYRMSRDIFGVGFKTADKIAQALGLPADHPSRIQAGLIYTLNQDIDEGHVYSPRKELAQHAANLLDASPELIPEALDQLAREDLVRVEVLPFLDKTKEASNQETQNGTILGESSTSSGISAIYLTALHISEKGVAQRFRSLASALPTRLSDVPPAFINLDPDLSSEQQAAIRTAISSPLSVLTGGPGTGKTTALKALIFTLESTQKTYALASPTGRAAKRLSQATGRPASTIHRLLAFSPVEGFKHNNKNPLKIDFLVIDEASMMDLQLTYNLLKAIQPGTHLLLVGDVDQLPSVGAGDVLRDVIASNIAPVTRLSVIFRQAADSHIITNAHRINQGLMPLFCSPTEIKQDKWPGDFFLFPAESPEEAANWVRDIVCNRIPSKFGLHPRDDIQVLAPMYRGLAGVTALNEALQENLNPPELMKPEKKLFGQIFRSGDKIMQTRNNYDKKVFNGDIGYLLKINPVEHTLTMDFESRTVEYDWSEADQLTLAYAVSVHKSQGSEFPAVVLLLLTQHYIMLQRNLLYTAITRAKQLCVLVGNRRAIAIAIHNDKVSHRHTALHWRLNKP
jgi:exodeoxyribonuclease V alpha subunit